MNLGIDFGSTYSMLSVYDPANDTVQPLILESGSPYIPSIACYDEEGNLITGHSVKEQIGYLPPDVRLFRAFKMLLTAHPERDRQTLLERGYTDEVTPGTITQEFLRQQIEIAKEHYRVEKFDNLVICVPEVWDTELHTMGGRDLLTKITKRGGTYYRCHGTRRRKCLFCTQLLEKLPEALSGKNSDCGLRRRNAGYYPCGRPYHRRYTHGDSNPLADRRR